MNALAHRPERRDAPSIGSAPPDPLRSGALAGVVGGVVLAALVALASGPTPGLLGLALSGPAALALHLAVAALLGTALAALFADAEAVARVSGGLLAGLLWWIATALTVAPLLLGREPTWSLAAADAAFPWLVADLAFCAVTALAVGPVGALLPHGAESEPQSERAAVQVLVLGGGFAGVAVAQRLERAGPVGGQAVETTLVSADNFLLFTPMLAAVTSGAVEPPHIGAPLRAACPRTAVRRGFVEAIETGSREVRVRDASGSPTTLGYDHLVLALGAVPAYRDLPGVEAHSLPVKTLEDATALRGHMIAQLERADLEPDVRRRRDQLTFVVAGGGYAGVEVIAELHDLALGVLHQYATLAPDQLRFVLVHSGERLLPEIGPRLADYALTKLRRRGIEVHLDERVAAASAEGVRLKRGGELRTETLVWTAGNHPHPLATALTGGDAVEPTLQLPGHADVWAIGDCARVPDPDSPGAAYPPTAQHAVREGRAVADGIVAVLSGEQPEPFRFTPLGVLVALGGRSAAAELGGRRFSGVIAWLMWRAVYLGKLPGAERKVRVLIDWALDLVFARDIAASGGEPPHVRSGAPAQNRQVARTGRASAENGQVAVRDRVAAPREPVA